MYQLLNTGYTSYPRCISPTGMFVENVLAEVKGKAKVVAMDKTGSVTLQQLMPLASLDQVGAVLAELWTGKEEESAAYKAMSCDRCAGHVVESALRQMCRWTGEVMSLL